MRECRHKCWSECLQLYHSPALGPHLANTQKELEARSGNRPQRLSPRPAPLPSAWPLLKQPSGAGGLSSSCPRPRGSGLRGKEEVTKNWEARDSPHCGEARYCARPWGQGWTPASLSRQKEPSHPAPQGESAAWAEPPQPRSASAAAGSVSRLQLRSSSSRRRCPRPGLPARPNSATCWASPSGWVSSGRCWNHTGPGGKTPETWRPAGNREKSDGAPGSRSGAEWGVGEGEGCVGRGR